MFAPEHGIRCPGCEEVVEPGEPCGSWPEGMTGEIPVVVLACVGCGTTEGTPGT